MLSKYLKYPAFWLKSSNQHGVHSPFVYQWVTKCLYAKPKLGANKTQNLVLQSIAYFGFTNLKIIGNTVLLGQIKKEVPWSSFTIKPLDFLFLEHPDWEEISSKLHGAGLHNNTMIVINNIHANTKNEALWQHLLGKTVFTVSIDLFHCGVLFLRKEQEKEHFTIRI